MDRQILRDLQRHQSSFFKANAEGGAQLASFELSWSSFSEAVFEHSGLLSQETLHEIYSFALIVEKVSAGFLEASIVREELYEEFTRDISLILTPGMANLSIDCPDTPEEDPLLHACAAEWLLCNLHNPYPHRATRVHISQQCRRSLKSVDNWFANARKRIGWNDLRRTYFPNGREEMLDMAAAFILSTGDASVKSAPKGAAEAFQALVSKAKAIYSIPLASTSTSASSRKQAQRRCHPYPTPEPSPERSPEPETYNESLFLVHNVCKRKWEEEEEIKPMKRPKPASPLVDPVHNLPSPAASVIELGAPSPRSTHKVFTSSQSEGRKRKRDLTEETEGDDALIQVKRHRDDGSPGPSSSAMAEFATSIAFSAVAGLDDVVDHLFQQTTVSLTDEVPENCGIGHVDELSLLPAIDLSSFSYELPPDDFWSSPSPPTSVLLTPRTDVDGYLPSTDDGQYDDDWCTRRAQRLPHSGVYGSDEAHVVDALVLDESSLFPPCHAPPSTLFSRADHRSSPPSDEITRLKLERIQSLQSQLDQLRADVGIV